MEQVQITISQKNLAWLQNRTGETEPRKAVAVALKMFKDASPAVDEDEEELVPIERLPKFLQQSERESRRGNNPRFNNAKDLMNWLKSRQHPTK
jgi:hypothetical protein